MTPPETPPQQEEPDRPSNWAAQIKTLTDRVKFLETSQQTPPQTEETPIVAPPVERKEPFVKDADTPTWTVADYRPVQTSASVTDLSIADADYPSADTEEDSLTQPHVHTGDTDSEDVVDYSSARKIAPSPNSSR